MHGRQRDRALHHAPARWEAVRAVRLALSIPVVSNGGVASHAAALQCLQETGCVAVMVATALLQNPELFLPHAEAPSNGQALGHCLAYLASCEAYPPWSLRWVRDHLRALLASVAPLAVLKALEQVEPAEWRHTCQQLRGILKALAVSLGP